MIDNSNPEGTGTEWIRNRSLDIEARAPERVAELEALLSKYDSLSVISAAKLNHIYFDPETYEEPTFKGKAAYVEYISLLLLKGRFEPSTNYVHKEQQWNEIHDAVEAVFYDEFVRSMAASMPAQDVEALSPLSEVLFTTRGHELIVRNRAYKQHLHQVMKMLFDPFQEELISHIGFGVGDALSVASAAVEIDISQYNLVLAQARKARLRFMRLAQSFRRKGKWPENTPVPKGFLDYISEADDAEALRAVKSIVAEMITSACRDCQIIKASRISETAGIPEGRVQAVLDAMSIKPGTIPSDFTFPSGVHPLRTRPFIRLGNTFVLPVPGGVADAIQAVLENVLKNVGGKTWARYHTHRHDTVLRFGLDLLDEAMPDAHIESSLYYEIEEEGNRKRAELDGLVVYDSVLFLVEAKGHSFTEPAKRGAAKRLKKHLHDVITKAHQQALRAHTYIKSHAQNEPTVSFMRSKGKPFELETSHIERVFLVSLSLEPLGHITGHLSSGKHGGIFADEIAPWALSIFDLVVIAELTDLAPMFPHYVERRMRAAAQDLFTSHDELDFFGHFLRDGLYYTKEELPVVGGRKIDSIQLGSFTVDIDAYYMHQEGVRRTFARKPRQKMSEDFRRLIRRIDRSGLAGRLEVALILLDLDQEARANIVKGVKKAVKRTKRRGRDQFFILPATDNKHRWGITVLTVQSKADADDKLARRCKKILREKDLDVIAGFALGSKAGRVFAVYNQQMDSVNEQSTR